MPETHPKPPPHSYELAPVHDVETESTELTLSQKTHESKVSDQGGIFSQYGWGLEILSASVSFLLFIGMVVIFWIMQDEPVSKWPFPISINATIAILSTACTAAMMHNVSAFIGQLKWLYLKLKPCQLYNVYRFDEASRGPYGSMLFLLNVSCNMATIGALITILRLGFAPMAQEVISLEPRPVNTTDNNATFGFVHSYNRSLNRGDNGVPTRDESSIGSRSTNLMKFAIYRTERDEDYMPLDADITECTLSLAAYEYTGAQANGSVFSFDNIQMVELEWSRPASEQAIRRLIDEMALQDFLQSPTFLLEFVEGESGSLKHGLSAVLGAEANLSNAFDNMATNMTDYVRSGPNMQLATGVRIDTEIFVAVRWYWLIGPGLIELASLLFAVATIVSNTRKKKVPLWKSSALVLLACQHDADERLIRGTSESVTELEKRARSSYVRLEQLAE
ncbi:hypothetical protein FCULG_00005742 [Fusarium culmorum]|uniref:Uncharacterized protein n=1 Tax=Fusarium culmorum TaxID=5516 RepID=A0A2T4GTU1_FUSCU|nr:hypothetical protein FCULG_00005742 [Fusarium culmorum]